MSSFENYRSAHVDMLHLVSHLLRLHRAPGFTESTRAERDAYDLIHQAFRDTLKVSYARLEAVGKAPTGERARAAHR